MQSSISLDACSSRSTDSEDTGRLSRAKISAAPCYFLFSSRGEFGFNPASLSATIVRRAFRLDELRREPVGYCTEVTFGKVSCFKLCPRPFSIESAVWLIIAQSCYASRNSSPSSSSPTMTPRRRRCVLRL